jgi:hypothetical protein
MLAIQRSFRCKLDDHINAAQEVTINVTVAGSGERLPTIPRFVPKIEPQGKN